MPGNKKKEIDSSELQRLAGLGLTQKEMAGALGMSEQTFYNRLKETPELIEFIERGKAEANAKVANALFNAAVKGNFQAIRWWEITRRGIRETVEIAAKGLSDEELIAKVRDIARSVSKSSSSSSSKSSTSSSSSTTSPSDSEHKEESGSKPGQFEQSVSGGRS